MAVFMDLDNTVWSLKFYESCSHNHQLLLFTCLLEIWNLDVFKDSRKTCVIDTCQQWHQWLASLLCFFLNASLLKAAEVHLIADQDQGQWWQYLKNTCRHTNDYVIHASWRYSSVLRHCQVLLPCSMHFLCALTWCMPTTLLLVYFVNGRYHTTQISCPRLCQICMLALSICMSRILRTSKCSACRFGTLLCPRLQQICCMHVGLCCVPQFSATVSNGVGITQKWVPSLA